MKITPFWKLQTKHQIGLGVGFTITKFDYQASRSFYELQLDLLFIRVCIEIGKKIK